MKNFKHIFPYIFVVNTKDFTNDDLNTLYNLSDEYTKNKADRLFLTQDKINCLCANVLRKYLIFKLFGINFEKQTLNFNKFNKPFLKDYEKIYFNISHSGNFVACVINDNEIGVDIQKITKYNDAVAKYIFDKKEYDSLILSKNKDLDFTKLWTKTESILKLQGNGFDFYKKSNKKNIKTKQKIIDNYVLSVSNY